MALPTLTTDERIEMIDEIRRLKRTGVPQVAQRIQQALDEGRYFVGETPKPVENPEPPLLNAKTEDWFAYAVEVSDIDVEVLEAATRSDIITMLRVNGLIEKS
jgi:hypothetical protein